MRKCTKCKRPLGLINFRKRSDSSGLHSWCRNCENKHNHSYKRAHPIKTKRANAQWYKRNPLYHMLQTARRRAQKERLGFNLTLDDLKRIAVSHCPIFGQRLEYGGGNGYNRVNAASLDRINNDKGYVRGNVAIISYRANVIKNSGTAEEHRKIAEYMESWKRK